MKRKKKANKQGSITKTKKSKPYWVRVTDPATGKRKSLGMYETRTKAQEVLNAYLVNPYEIDNSKIIFSEVYNLFIKNQKEMVSKATLESYQNSYKRCEPLYNLIFREIKAPQMQQVLNSLKISIATKKITKTFLTTLFNYGMELEIIAINRAKYIKLPKAVKQKDKNIFSDYEIKKLWENVTLQWVDYILIMIYTGFRIGELLELKNKDINLINKTITGGIKTEAGKNRLVPIHPKILPLIEKRYNESNELFIVNAKGKEMKYSNYYREKFLPIMKNLNMKHRPHDCRHTFATLLSNANANSTAIKKMIGHESFITTEKIYTHKDIEELRKNIELIK